MIELDLDLQRGEFQLQARLAGSASALALFGPSGSGKSSLLLAIAGLLQPKSGHISLAGRCLYDSSKRINLPARQRAIGMVFQDLRLFPHLDVRSNLLFGAQHSGHAEVSGFDTIVGLLGLARLLRRQPRSLSGGEARRVAIGRALLTRPSALLLDEPLSGLHREARDDVLSHLRDIRQQLKVPVLLVSHQADEVIALADSVALIEVGRITDQIDTATFATRQSTANAVPSAGKP